MHLFGHFNGESGKSSMKGLSDTSTGSNNDVFGDGEFAMLQVALIITSILMDFIIAGIMGYFFANLREDCGDGNKSGAVWGAVLILFRYFRISDIRKTIF